MKLEARQQLAKAIGWISSGNWHGSNVKDGIDILARLIARGDLDVSELSKTTRSQNKLAKELADEGWNAVGEVGMEEFR